MVQLLTVGSFVEETLQNYLLAVGHADVPATMDEYGQYRSEQTLYALSTLLEALPGPNQTNMQNYRDTPQMVLQDAALLLRQVGGPTDLLCHHIKASAPALPHNLARVLADTMLVPLTVEQLLALHSLASETELLALVQGNVWTMQRFLELQQRWVQERSVHSGSASSSAGVGGHSSGLQHVLDHG